MNLTQENIFIYLCFKNEHLKIVYILTSISIIFFVHKMFDVNPFSS